MRPYAVQALRDALGRGVGGGGAGGGGASASQHAPLAAYVAPTGAPSVAGDMVCAAIREAVATGSTVGLQAAAYHEGP